MFIHVLKLGYVGAALAYVCSNVYVLVMLSSYVWCSNLGYRVWGGMRQHGSLWQVRPGHACNAREPCQASGIQGIQGRAGTCTRRGSDLERKKRGDEAGERKKRGDEAWEVRGAPE